MAVLLAKLVYSEARTWGFWRIEDSRGTLVHYVVEACRKVEFREMGPDILNFLEASLIRVFILNGCCGACLQHSKFSWSGLTRMEAKNGTKHPAQPGLEPTTMKEACKDTSKTKTRQLCRPDSAQIGTCTLR